MQNIYIYILCSCPVSRRTGTEGNAGCSTRLRGSVTWDCGYQHMSEGLSYYARTGHNIPTYFRMDLLLFRIDP